MAQPTVDDVAAKFCRIVSQMIEVVADMTEDLRLAGFTESTSEQMLFVAQMVKAYDNHKLVGMFIQQHPCWKGIINRDLNFFVKNLPKLFEGMPVDTSLMTGPIEAYLQHKAGTLPAGKGKFPITDSRIEGLWKYFDQLMRGAFVYARMTKTDSILAGYKVPLGM